MIPWPWLPAAVFLAFWLGFALAAMLSAAAREDEQQEREDRTRRDV